MQFEPVKKVTELSLDGSYAFVEGSMTGIPINELTKVDPPAAKRPVVSPPIKPIAAGQKQDVFSLDEGQAVIQWPANMSKESFEDFEDWLKLLVKKVGRAYRKGTDKKESG